MPRPESFRSRRPPTRIIGTEMEYGLPDGLLKPVEIVHHIQNQTGTANQGPNQTSSFLSNGGRTYQELEKLIEYATPESLGPRDAVLSDLAGQELVRRAVFELQEKRGIDSHSFKNGLYRRVGFYVLNQPTSERMRMRPDYQATGYHETYYTLRWPKEQSLPATNYLGSYLGTRAIWAGSGMFYKGELLTSQKNISVGGISGGKSCNLSSRVLFRQISEEGTGFQRIEVRSNEPNRNPYIQWLGFSATSLALRLIEYSPGRELEHLTLSDPVAATHATAFRGLSAILRTSRGTTIRPLEYQHAVFESIEKHINKSVQLPAEEAQALEKLLNITAATSHSELYLGWYPRKRYLSRKFSDLGPDSTQWPIEDVVYYDMMMDNLLLPFNSLEAVLKYTKDIPGKDMATAIEERLLVPPSTRAQRRAKNAPHIKGWASWNEGKKAKTCMSPYL